ncbi:leucyl aminopeptidase family protein [Pseudoxanthobacter sp. M-2]|uniref:leucyl aminopeptidase family protein n=1 Tax=Pseudoxanthobacter sp. M-2 TaxID=3078754 RepID=UPI0038FC62E9
MPDCFAPPTADAVPVHAVRPDGIEALAARLPPAAAAWLAATGFEAGAGAVVALPGETGRPVAAVLGLGKPQAAGRIPAVDPLAAGVLATALPAGTYTLASGFEDPAAAALAFALGSYRFERYRSRRKTAPRLVLPEGADGAEIARIADAVFRGRDLVNTPANDLGPAEIADAVRALAERHGADFETIVGEDLLARNFPLIHAVGAASTRAPRLVDLTWGNPAHPKVTLVGKGVAFDTGGLNIKPDASMLLMKKDMGGAAAAIALADMIMDAGLPVRLRLLVAAVENSISGNAFRPGDVYRSRKGITVEIGNTDAEGRLILADALALADEEAPEVIVDFATLTGAARVALGPDLPPLYTDDDGFAEALLAAGTAVGDPLWRMPLWRPYEKMLDSKVSDINHISGGAFAGSITAALFLSRFVEKAKTWAHLDVFAWVPSAKPGRPEGGEAHSARALYALFKARYGAGA